MEDITSDNLPLDVRELLMRGQEANAVNKLIDDYNVYDKEASKIIRDYRKKLKQRKIELDLAIMNENNINDEKLLTPELTKWIFRGVVVLLIIIFISMVLNYT